MMCVYMLLCSAVNLIGSEMPLLSILWLCNAFISDFTIVTYTDKHDVHI